jgi:hypothetical protein
MTFSTRSAVGVPFRPSFQGYQVAPDPQNAPLAFYRPLRGISGFALGSWLFGADHGLRWLRARTMAALAAAKRAERDWVQRGKPAGTVQRMRVAPKRRIAIAATAAPSQELTADGTHRLPIERERGLGGHRFRQLFRRVSACLYMYIYTIIGASEIKKQWT